MMTRPWVAAATLLAVIAALSGCERVSTWMAAGALAPRSFMQGGVWFPAVTGYWFHQYVVGEQLDRFLADTGFACTPAESSRVAGTERLRCERSFRVPGGLLSRTDSVEFGFRRNGAVALAESGCRYAFFDSPRWAGECTPFAAPGAIYPSVSVFADVVLAMLQPAGRHSMINVSWLPPGTPSPLADASEAVDRLARWRFECDTPQQQYRTGFRGNVGQITEATCAQSSLQTPARPPQRQQVVIRYDSANLAVLGIEVRLDDAKVALPPGLHTKMNAAAGNAGAPPAAPKTLKLANRTGEQFEVTMGSIGTGSRQATLEAFALLTPASQRDLLSAYLSKQEAQWTRSPPDRLSYLNAMSLEWYGPEAIPLLGDMLTDERPAVGVALMKYLCYEVPARSEPQADASLRAERLLRSMQACIDLQRSAMPKSLALMDQLLAQDLRVLATSNAAALNAFGDFRRDILYVIALGPDARDSRAALEGTLAGKAGLSPAVQRLVEAALGPRDAPAFTAPAPAPR